MIDGTSHPAGYRRQPGAILRPERNGKAHG